MRDVPYALRVLRNNPGFAAAAIMTLALGLGVNTTIFSLFDAVALRPIPLGGTTQAVSVYQQIHDTVSSREIYGSTDLLSYPEFVRYRDESQVFTGAAAYVPEFSALIGSDPHPVRGQLTTCNYYDVVGVRPALGRGFVASECAGDGAGPVVVLSDAMWRNDFAADPRIIGKVVRLNRVPLTVIGVAPAGFAGTEIVVPSFWVPISMQYALAERSQTGSFLGRADVSWLAMVARLKPGVTIDKARASLAVVAARIDREHPARTTMVSVTVPSYFAQPDKHRVVLAVGAVFIVAVGLVLLIACANVANLFLARALARQREIAIRLALGASRARLVRQLMTESAVVAVAGATLGTVVALWSAAAIANLVVHDPTSTPITVSVVPDVHIFAYASFLACGTALAFGLAPALQATRPDVNRSLKGEGSEADVGHTWLRGALVGIQVSVCMVLLIAAGLLLRGLDYATSVDPGFPLDGTTVLQVDLTREGYTLARAADFHRAIVDRLRSAPGIALIAEGETAPLSGRHHFSAFKTPGGTLRGMIEVNDVTPGYLATIGLPLVRGRDIDASSVRSGQGEVMVNETAARLFFGGNDPVGSTLRDPKEREYLVTGVVRDAQLGELGKPHTPYLFRAATDSDALSITSIIVRTRDSRGSSSRAAVSQGLRAAALSVDRDLHLSVNPLRDNLAPYIQGSRLFASLSSILGTLALLLATIGIYGTVAFTVARRTREIGIRVALGARSAHVISLVVAQAMRPVLIGAAIGTLVCAGLSRVLAPVLFGVSPVDGVAFGVVPAFLLAVALLGSWIPARRAAAIDAMAALRAV